MTITPEPGFSAYPDMNRRLGENVATMMFRLGWKQKDLAAASGITTATLSRKLLGVGDWTVMEAGRMAVAFDVEPHELMSVLPNFDEWEARRSARLQGFEPRTFCSVVWLRPRLSIVKGGLTAEFRPAEAGTRHLSAVS